MSQFKITEYYLLGESKEFFSRIKLPTNRDVLLVLLYHLDNTRGIRKSVDNSINHILKEILSIWENRGLKVRKKSSIKKQIEKLYEKWLRLKLNRLRFKTVLIKSKELDFKKKLMHYSIYRQILIM